MNEQLELSTYIKSVHKKLREDAKVVGYEKAWRSHVADGATLSKYASTMRTLACDHWSRNEAKENSKVTPRNAWIHENCLDYFRNGLLYQRQREVDIAGRNELDCDSSFTDLEVPDLSGKLRVLDVGSCYNPLAVYGEFDVLPIDIAPGSEEVFQCDFLNLNIGAEEILSGLNFKNNQDVSLPENSAKRLKQVEVFQSEINLTHDKTKTNIYLFNLSPGRENYNANNNVNVEQHNDNQGIKRTIETLDEHETNNKINNRSVKQLKSVSFDVITFCLLLEYLPDASQRLECCKKAYELLKPEGLLVILTPDSKHVGKNAAFMKSWRFALAKIGFSRIKYEKLAYVHCMLFRKNVNQKVAKRWAEIEKNKPVYDGIYIPQDFNCANPKSITSHELSDSKGVTKYTMRFINIPYKTTEKKCDHASVG